MGMRFLEVSIPATLLTIRGISQTAQQTGGRVVIEDWRWKYNHERPHRPLGHITPNEFAQDEVGEEASSSQCRAFGRATPSLRPSIDLLYDIEQIINPSRLTKALAQFE